MNFTYYTIAGKDPAMIDGHLYNVTQHAGLFDIPSVDVRCWVVIYVNDNIPPIVTSEIERICEGYDVDYVHYEEPPDHTFLQNLYACWNRGYELANEGWVFRGGCDQAFNRGSMLAVWEAAQGCEVRGQKVVLNANTIEHEVRAMSHGNKSRHLLANFGDHFRNFDVDAFEDYCTTLKKPKKHLLTIEESLAEWGKPTPFKSTIHPQHNRTEGCSWLIKKADWEQFGPMPPRQDGLTGDCWLHDQLELAGYKDYIVRDCITYHFFRGESIHRYA